MAEAMFEDLQVYGKKFVTIAGSFAPQGTGAPTILYGTGFTVAFTDTGKWTITLSKRYARLISAVASLQLATADDKYVLIGSTSVGLTATNTIVIHNWDISGAAATNIDANAAGTDIRINFVLVLKNTSAVNTG